MCANIHRNVIKALEFLRIVPGKSWTPDVSLNYFKVYINEKYYLARII